MLTPDMKLVIIMNQIGPLKSPAKSNGSPIDPTNMRNVTNNIFHGERLVSFSISSSSPMIRKV